MAKYIRTSYGWEKVKLKSKRGGAQYTIGVDTEGAVYLVKLKRKHRKNEMKIPMEQEKIRIGKMDLEIWNKDFQDGYIKGMNYILWLL